MALVPINAANAHVFDVLVQDYEAEFSATTHKEPNSKGVFTLEATWKKPYKGFYQFIDKKPVGFAIVGKIEECSDMSEFYILPCYRGKGLGKAFACEVFNYFPGAWQVRQIINALDAQNFWKSTIRSYTHGNYTEDVVSDSQWGMVVRQLFISPLL